MGNKKRSNPPRPPDLALVAKLSAFRWHVPPLYKVYLLNDDYTPMNFVVEVLERYFSLDHQIATEIMLQIHQKGKGICGLYRREIAETKVVQVNEYARRNQYPLLCKMEETGAN